jgi:hypothetical protein
MKRYRLSTKLAWRSTAAVAVAVLTVTGTAGAAFADGAQHSTETDILTGASDRSITCGGPTYTVTDNITLVSYIVETDSGQTGSSPTLHIRVVTLSDSFTGIPRDDPTLPTVEGTIEGTGTIHSSAVGAAGQTTNAFLTATFSDGTTVTTRETFHFTKRPDGTLVAYFDPLKCS